jgi:hypothetical protein
LEVAVSVPVHLADRMSEALGALYRHPNQTLLAWYRYAIYDAIVMDRSQASYAARAWVDVLSAQHVVFCWQPYARMGWPTTWLQPTDLLELAAQSLQGMLDPPAVERQITRAEALADVVGEPATSAHYPAWCVFEAALRALQSAWVAHTNGATPIAPKSWMAGAAGLDDASWYAAIAIAGSLTTAWDDPRTRTIYPDRVVAPANAAAQLRQTFFWEWWLREAIPQAWQRRYTPARPSVENRV